MKYSEARQQIIQTWSQMGSKWGINRTMAEMHATLIISPAPMTADQLMEDLNISRGNVSMNLRGLIEWGVVQKVFVTGDRRDYFTAEKDVWKMSLMIARERKRRELDPLIVSLKELQITETEEGLEKETEELNRISGQLLDVAMQVEKLMDISIRSGSQSLVRKLISLLR